MPITSDNAPFIQLPDYPLHPRVRGAKGALFSFVQRTLFVILNSKFWILNYLFLGFNVEFFFLCLVGVVECLFFVG